MNALLWLNPGRGLMLLAVVGALSVGYVSWQKYQQEIGEDRVNTRWIRTMDKQKSDAKTLLETETAKVTATEQQLREFKATQELQDADHKKTIVNLSARLLNAGRLRDPNSSGCGSGSNATDSSLASSSNPGTANTTEAGGLLSEPASKLLQTLVQEADEINIAYLSCREDASNIRATLAKQQSPTR